MISSTTARLVLIAVASLCSLAPARPLDSDGGCETIVLVKPGGDIDLDCQSSCPNDICVFVDVNLPGFPPPSNTCKCDKK